MEKRGTYANVEEFGLSDSESYVILHRVLLSEVQEWDCCLLRRQGEMLRFATGPQKDRVILCERFSVGFPSVFRGIHIFLKFCRGSCGSHTGTVSIHCVVSSTNRMISLFYYMFRRRERPGKHVSHSMTRSLCGGLMYMYI